MNPYTKTACQLCACTLSLGVGSAVHAERPNIVIILTDDLGQKRNLALDHPDKVDALRQRLTAISETE